MSSTVFQRLRGLLAAPRREQAVAAIASIQRPTYNPQTERVIPREQANFDPNVFGRYDLRSQRIVPIDAPESSPAGDLDLLMATAQRAMRNGQPISRDRYAVVLRQLEPGSGLLLDACTGGPRDDVVSAVEAAGYTYQAIDLRGDGKRVKQEDLTGLSFADGSVARIISVDTLEHIPAWPRAVGEMFRVLQPGGLAIVHVPCYYFEKASGEPIEPGMDRYGHIRYFSGRELLACYAETGFVVLRAELIMDYGASLSVLYKPAATAAD
ncbi:MAG: methyltransferase domain-containing protein [Gammaproteobacteria bacterium]